MQKSLYKFLDSYSREDRDIFFGRDREIEELHSKVFDSRILVVYGTSGTGKSSLINCGLANKFNDADWLPINVRRGLNINQSFYDTLQKTGVTAISKVKKEGSDAGSRNLVRIIRSIYLDHFKPIYIIFDQFEELFIFGSQGEKDELVTGIKQIIDSDLQCRFIFCIREEYLAGFTEFEKVIPTFLGNRVRIEKMTRLNAMEVIEGPCRMNNIRIEEGFARLLLEKLNPDSPEVELTYLQVYLDRIFRQASPDGRDVEIISIDMLDRAGDVKDLLGSFLEEQISQLDDPETGMLVLKAFVSVRGTKTQVTEDDILEYTRTLGRDIGRETVRSLVQRFIRLRILRDKDEYDRYELRHDSLATKIYEQITLVEKELLEIRQFLENACSNFEKRQLYLSADDLQYIAPYEDRLFLSDRLEKFISQSRWFIHRAKRRRQNALIITAVSIITILSFFSLWALKERGNAIEQRQLANSQKNSALRAKEVADSARQEALLSRNLAVEKENLARLARKQSELARQEAVAERENALRQKNIAEQLSVVASEQAQIANAEKIKAEEERTKAVTAEEKARRLGFLSTAQNLALKSSNIENNPELAGLLAVQAFVLNKHNNGLPEDPVIYEALNRAASDIDDNHRSVYRGSPNEIRVLACRDNGTLLSSDLDGTIRKWAPDGTGEVIARLTSDSEINFIGSNVTGGLFVTQHDNNDLYLWKEDITGNKYSGPAALTGHKGYVRALAFSEDKKLMATGGRDSLIIIWDVSTGEPSGSDEIRADDGIRAMIFAGPDDLVIALENGTIVQRNIRTNADSILYSSSSAKPLCLAWNRNKSVLVSGFSDGALLFFKKTGSGFSRPVEHIAHTAGIDLVIFNQDYTLMATSGRDKLIRFYNYHEFFEMDNPVGSVVSIRNPDQRTRSMVFTDDGKLAAGLSDKSIRIWETSSENLASLICRMVNRAMTPEEWNEMVGPEIPYENTCRKTP